MPSNSTPTQHLVVVHEAVRSLIEMGPASAPVLVDLLEEETHIRVQAAYALGEIGPGARMAIPALQELVDRDPKKNFACSAALKKIQGLQER